VIFNVKRMVFFGPVPPRRGTFWPRLAEPERTLPLLKSDMCATDPAGLRYGNRIGNRVIMGSYGDWDLRPRLRTLNGPTLVVHGEEVCPTVERFLAGLEDK
jgi:pimeloyl-ACP methyl ester carboxylesterase